MEGRAVKLVKPVIPPVLTRHRCRFVLWDEAADESGHEHRRGDDPEAKAQAKAAARVSGTPGPRPRRLTAKSSSAHNTTPLPPTPTQRASTRGGARAGAGCPASSGLVSARPPPRTYYIYSVVSSCGKAWSLELCGPMGPLEAEPAALRTGLTWFRSILCDV